MTSKQAPRRKVATTRPGALIVLALAACVHPALAATGSDARCDQAMDAPPMSRTNQGQLAIEVIDHGTPAALTADAISLEESDTAIAPDAVGESSKAQVELMLRDMFDQPVAAPPKLSKSGEAGDRRMPLAVEKPESVDEPSSVLDADPADAAAELPGLSRDDLVRYRQQMYRRDI